VEKDSMRIAEIIVGLSDINLLGVKENNEGPLRIHIECRGMRPLCPTCGGRVHQNGLRITELVDLPAFERNIFIIWHKRRWRCALKECLQPSFSDNDPRITESRLRLRNRASMWATQAVGLERRSVSWLCAEYCAKWPQNLCGSPSTRFAPVMRPRSTPSRPTGIILHLLVSYPPKVSLSKLVMSLKTISSM